MLRAYLKPDGFTVPEVITQIRIEQVTGQNRQNRRIRTARSNREYLYWLANHHIRRVNRAAKVTKELVDKVAEESEGLTYCEIAERAFEQGAGRHASWVVADCVIAKLEQELTQ